MCALKWKRARIVAAAAVRPPDLNGNDTSRQQTDKRREREREGEMKAQTQKPKIAMLSRLWKKILDGLMVLMLMPRFASLAQSNWDLTHTIHISINLQQNTHTHTINSISNRKRNKLLPTCKLPACQSRHLNLQAQHKHTQLPNAK